MNKTFRTCGIFLACVAVILAARACFCMERVVRITDGRVIDFGRMIAEVKGGDLVFVGELHDQKWHHENQLRIIKALYGAGVPLAIGLEMFTAESQPALDRWVAGKMEKESFVRLYYENWQMPWSLYGDIFLYARQHRIPLIGLNVPREIVQRVASQGFESLASEERKRLPSGITCDVDKSYMAFIKRAFAEHAGNEKTFVHFCEAQMLWTKSMAWRLTDFLDKHPRKTVVVLTGAGHAMKRGIPEQVGQSSRYSYKVILPEISDMPIGKVGVGDADYIVLGN